METGPGRACGRLDDSWTTPHMMTMKRVARMKARNGVFVIGRSVLSWSIRISIVDISKNCVGSAQYAYLFFGVFVDFFTSKKQTGSEC